MSTETTEPIVPAMGAEAGYAVDESTPPMRVTGYLSLIFGLLSVTALIGPAALVCPILALLFGLIALRRYGEQVPAGLVPARIGLLLAALFGTWGAGILWMKHNTLARQAEKFARYYVEVVARDEAELALELRKSHVNRFQSTMPLKAFYKMNPNSQDQLIEFRDDGINQLIRRRGPGAEWKLTQPVRVFTHYGMQQAEVLMADPADENTEIFVVLEYKIDAEGNGQWHVVRAQENSEIIYAPAVL